MAAACVPIQYLEIGKYKSDIALANEIGKFSQLKGLVLKKNIEACEVMKIVKKLSALTTLSVNIRILTSTELLQLIRFAPKLQTLSFQNHEINLCLDANLYSEILIAATSRQEKFRLEIRFPQKKIHQNCLKLKHELLQITGVISPLPTTNAFISIG